MRKITLLEDEWSGLRRLAPMPRRRVFADEELGPEVVRFLIEKGLLERREDLVAVTAIGEALLRANPPVSPVGVRVWVQPAS